jgi:hypothetical protein
MRIRPSPPTMALPLALVLLAGLAAAGCAAGGTRSEEGSARSQPNVITEQQIVDSNLSTAFDVVRSLRPAWLRQRPMSISNPEGAEVAVYVDGARMAGGLESLRQLRAENLTRMEFMSASDATTRYGTGHMGGAILVTTRRG